MEKEPNGLTIKKFEGSKAKEFIQTHKIELNMPYETNDFGVTFDSSFVTFTELMSIPGLFIETHGEY